jgi:hypothetical protein
MVKDALYWTTRDRDPYLQYFSSPGQPIVYTQRSTLVAEGSAVLSPEQTYRLGAALDAIHKYFFSAYGAAGGWYALEVDWKFDDKRALGQPSRSSSRRGPIPAPSTRPLAAVVPPTEGAARPERWRYATFLG